MRTVMEIERRLLRDVGPAVGDHRLIEAMVRAVGIGGVVLASFVAGCGSGTLGGGGAPRWIPQVDFQTPDRSTGISVGMVRIYSFDDEIPQDLVDTVASRIRVATWPGDIVVPATQTLLAFPTVVLPNGGQMAGYVEIDEHLDPSVDPSAWYAISMPPPTAAYSMPANPTVLALDGGATAVRFSPAHAPVVAVVIACAKEQGQEPGVVAVYAGYSEPVSRSAGAPPALDYGTKPISCTVGDDSSGETQFICANAGSEGQPFLLRIPDGVTAQASGMAMLPTTLDANGMQTGTTSNNCTIHVPLTPD